MPGIHILVTTGRISLFGGRAMRPLRETCPRCDKPMFLSRFDATFKKRNAREERQVFGLIAALCNLCRELYIDPELLTLLNLEEFKCTFAIEQDAAWRARVNRI